eukprot:4067667-Amphidinium_carterae.1
MSFRDFEGVHQSDEKYIVDVVGVREKTAQRSQLCEWSSQTERKFQNYDNSIRNLPVQVVSARNKFDISTTSSVRHLAAVRSASNLFCNEQSSESRRSVYNNSLEVRFIKEFLEVLDLNTSVDQETHERGKAKSKDPTKQLDIPICWGFLFSLD